MKKVNVKSVENKHNYVSGDYVIEAKLNDEQYDELWTILTALLNMDEIEGYEFALAVDKTNYNAMMNTAKMLNIPTLECEPFSVANRNSKPSNKCEALSVYGKRASVVAKDIQNFIYKNYGLNTKAYRIVS